MSVCHSGDERGSKIGKVGGDHFGKWVFKKPNQQLFCEHISKYDHGVGDKLRTYLDVNCMEPRERKSLQRRKRLVLEDGLNVVL